MRPQAQALLLAQAPRHLVGPVLGRLGAEHLESLFRGPDRPPYPVLEAAAEHPSRAVRAALVANPDVPPTVLGRVLATADPRMAWQIALHPRANRELMINAMATADADLSGTRVWDRSERELIALVESGDPATIRYTLPMLTPRWNLLSARSLHLRGLRNLRALAGPAAATREFRDPHGFTRPDLVRVRRALEHPKAAHILDRLSVRGRRRLDLVRVLAAYDQPGPHDRLRQWLLLPRDAIDWRLALREDRRKPWSAHAAEVLADQAGCPV
ncbi:MAG: hypothetical protein HOV68_19570, partial [Streptomycetaceae bacterium]|nr:hypothetical protein [Streptomycetaceae bacterium]